MKRNDGMCDSGDVTSKPMPVRRSGTEFVTAIPSEAGYAVGMIEYKGQVLLACQFAIYQLSKSKVFKKIKFEVDNGDQKTS